MANAQLKLLMLILCVLVGVVFGTTAYQQYFKGTSYTVTAPLWILLGAGALIMFAVVCTFLYELFPTKPKKLP